MANFTILITRCIVRVKLVRILIMKKLTLYLLFLSFFLLPAFCFAEVPSRIGGNTMKDICKIADCGEGADIYYRQHYFTGRIHKAFVIDVWDGGKAVGGVYMSSGHSSASIAKRHTLNYCKREKGSNCQVLFLDNKIADKELYEKLTTRYIPPNARASGNSWKCNYGYKKTGNMCTKETVIPTNAHASGSSWACNAGYQKLGSTCNKIYVPKNASLSGSSWKCNTGFTKDGNSCNKVEESTDYIEELKKIKELLDSGVINEEEFKKMKQKIIDNM